ncbi:hypothetical protein F0169_17580 [Pseudomonas sp. MAFF 212408]|uniref:DUF1534 domain-containing protein n=1 Tax=Pseudomonas kitaguniensis TaxID=2607908 RepID=A0A5N7KPR5_9PSED|nr:hypothetical protein [Pseudomonas kitaguniensis]
MRKKSPRPGSTRTTARSFPSKIRSARSNPDRPNPLDRSPSYEPNSVKCGSGLARDGGTSDHQEHPVDAIASKPAPTVDRGCFRAV